MPVERPRVYLTSLIAQDNPALARVRSYPPSPRYEIAGDMESADIVLLVESGYVGLDGPAKLRRLRRTTDAEFYMYSESDWPFAFLPGVFPSLAKPVPWAASWAFALDRLPPTRPPKGDAKYLFSFIGRASTHPLRQRILALDNERTPCLDLAGAPERFPGWDYKSTFEEVVSDSRFVLCPRGIGVSTIRIFEAMRAGRVPVIISDDWIEPPAIDWPNVSIRVPEGACADIPAICERHRSSAPDMGARARLAYQERFAPEVFVDNALDHLRHSSKGANAKLTSLVGHSWAALSFREFRSAASGLKRGMLRNVSASAS